ncbi:MAG: hypothetical protein AB8E82_12295 [Aureispira sp.]
MEQYTSISSVVTLHPNGIVESKAREDWNEPDTIETVTAHALLIKKVIDGKQRGLLVILPGLHMNRELLEVYNQTEMEEVAAAFLVNSFGAKVLGNLVLRIKKKGAPARLFTDRAAAEAWLLQFIAAEK